VSANPTKILPLRPAAPPTLPELVQQWIEQKRAEDEANARRLAIEQQIVAMQPPKEEGSSTVDLPGGLKLTLTGKLSYRVVDMEALKQLQLQLPPDRRIVKQELTLDSTGAKWLRQHEPAMWAIVAPAIEVKPAKVGVKVGF
jgi:hypothetical protein